jgi:hypothetical protein
MLMARFLTDMFGAKPKQQTSRNEIGVTFKRSPCVGRLQCPNNS